MSEGIIAGALGASVAFILIPFLHPEVTFRHLFYRWGNHLWLWGGLLLAVALIVLINWGLADIALQPTRARNALAVFNGLSGFAFVSTFMYLRELLLRNAAQTQARTAQANLESMMIAILVQIPSRELRREIITKLEEGQIIAGDSAERLRTAIDLAETWEDSSEP